MVSRKRGRIINVSSGVGYSRVPQMSAYAAAKAALNQWAKVLAEDVRPHGIAVFAFHPGLVRTSMAEAVSAADTPREVGDVFRAMFRDGRDTLCFARTSADSHPASALRPRGGPGDATTGIL